jgi:RNA polymerase sigma-70 factor (ECF subfamily)
MPLSSTNQRLLPGLGVFSACWCVYLCTMSATFPCLTLQRVSGFASAARPEPYSFSSLMKDENKELARGLQRRDPELLDRLIEQYQFRLFRYLVYITGDRTHAEDFFQETWIRVLERGHQYDGKSRFEGWLFTIARNLVIDWQRRRKTQSLDALTDIDQAHPLQVKDERAASALEVVLHSEQDAQVHDALGQIAAVYREVLLLRFQEELQIEEIATVLGAPASTVKSRLYRGLEALRHTLQPGVS